MGDAPDTRPEDRNDAVATDTATTTSDEMGSLCSANKHTRPATPPPATTSKSEQDDFIDDLIENAVILPPKSEIAIAQNPTGKPALTPSELESALSSAVLGDDYTLSGERHLVKVVSVYDGDTLRIVFYHEGRMKQYRCRMAGYDSPEMKPPKKDPLRIKTKRAAEKVRDALAARVAGLVFAEFAEFDMYGRPLIELYLRDARDSSKNGENLNQWMLGMKYGLPYDGGKKTEYTEAILDQILAA